MDFLALEHSLATTSALTAVFSMFGAVLAGIAAIGSYRLARKISDELKTDEVLVVGVLHHPDLRDSRHSLSVLETTVFNKSKRKVVITCVKLLGAAGEELPISWSSSIDEYGNPQGDSRMIGVVDASPLFLRHTEAEPIVTGVVEIHHTFENSPLRITYEMPPGWDAWELGGKPPG
jgi:hypothetical protein